MGKRREGSLSEREGDHSEMKDICAHRSILIEMQYMARNMPKRQSKIDDKGDDDDDDQIAV